jgi:hypothetical protein
MSKKLIAVASAAAIALTALVGVAPATAMPVSDTSQGGGNSLLVTSTGSRIGSAGAGTLASPYEVAVPVSGLATSGSTIRFSLSATASRAFTVAATSGIKVVSTISNTTAVVLTGADSLSGTTSATGTAEFFAYPTSTTRGVVTLTFDGDVTQVYITGTAGTAYDIGAVTLPSMEPSKTGVVVAVVTDAFGNATETGTLTASLTGTGSPTKGDITYSTTSKRWEGTQTAGANAGQLALGLTISGLTATDAQKAAFGAPNNTYFGIITVAGAKTVTELNAEITTLKASVATLTADYNKLVKKWNKRVASKTAPKKKAALK